MEKWNFLLFTRAGNFNGWKVLIRVKICVTTNILISVKFRYIKHTHQLSAHVLG